MYRLDERTVGERTGNPAHSTGGRAGNFFWRVLSQVGGGACKAKRARTNQNAETKVATSDGNLK